ncbi:unnamed protein product [Nyctereutes procyonoides]|uniref:(raccoon dog) hypothetical protein n=1 Tax=Nyctereutes procyonoides TaxID=34880 RepID=A0A811ZEG4_NYCPR|nr:unnamed protein product [Nyctereutes procyonoides]
MSMTNTVVAAGLTIAAAGLAVYQNLPKSAISGGYYIGGFESKMTKQEATLILDINRRGSPYIAAKINKAKEFLEGQAKK